jgi:O-antigen ligase
VIPSDAAAVRSAPAKLSTVLPSGSLLVRSGIFCIALLVTIVPLTPFGDLSASKMLLAWESGDVANQVVFTALALAIALVISFENYRRLASLASPTLLLALAWMALTVALSQNPEISARRFGFTLIVMFIAGAVLLLPFGLRHFASMLMVLLAGILVVSYVGLLLAPAATIHQSTDLLEPELHGSWRGLFGHKNEAGAVMALFFVFGLFIARAHNATVGIAIALASVVFLLFSSAKTSLILLPFILAISSLCERTRGLPMRIFLCLTPLLVLIFIVLVACYSPAIADQLNFVLSDTSFTGRTDVWKFAIDRSADRPLVGSGFMAFWRTNDLLAESIRQSWANTASHSHNGYFDMLLTTGAPGLLLAVVVIVVLPVLNFHHCREFGENRHLALLFLQIWLFGIYFNCFESALFDRANRVWFFLIWAVFGLHFLARYKVKSA